MRTIALFLALFLALNASAQTPTYHGSFIGNGAQLTNIPPTGLQSNSTSPSATLYYRGDGTWSTPPGSGGGAIVVAGTNIVVVQSGSNFTVSVANPFLATITGQAFLTNLDSATNNFGFIFLSNMYSFFTNITGSGSGTILSNTGSAVQWVTSPTGGSGGSQTPLTNNLDAHGYYSTNWSLIYTTNEDVSAQINAGAATVTNKFTNSVLSASLIVGTDSGGALTTTTTGYSPTLNLTNSTNFVIANLNTNGATNGTVLAMGPTTPQFTNAISANLTGNGGNLTNIQAGTATNLVTGSTATNLTLTGNNTNNSLVLSSNVQIKTVSSSTAYWTNLPPRQCYVTALVVATNSATTPGYFTLTESNAASGVIITNPTQYAEILSTGTSTLGTTAFCGSNDTLTITMTACQTNIQLGLQYH